MFKSKLFIKYFLTIVTILLIFTALLYVFSRTFIEEKVFKIEKSSARTVLDNVYEMVRSIDNGLRSYRESALQAKKRDLKNIVMMAEGYINVIEEQAGGSSHDSIENKILETIGSFKYGNDDYIFIFDNNSLILAHPDKQLVGRKWPSLTDISGKLVVSPMAKAALTEDEGYYTYKWKRLGTEDKPMEKLTYFKYLPKWKWIIATGVYIYDIDKAANAMMSVAIDNLRKILRDVKIAKTGYVFIFTSNDNSTSTLLVHPNKDMESTNMEQLIDPVTNVSLYKELTAAADNPNGLRYKWDKPEDPGHYVYDKISWVRYYKPLGWYVGTSVYMDELQSSSQIMGRRILAIAFSSLMLLIFIGYVFSKRMVSPLKRLSEMALRVKGGDLTAAIDIKRDDEIGILADAFNSMVEQLRGNFASLDAKVKERTAELQAAYDKLKVLDELKSAFLSNVSHELRTPLTSIYGFAEIIKESFENTVLPHVNIEGKKVERSVRRINENITIIISESERLTSLINNLLDLTKMEAGQMVWNKDIINVQNLLNHAVRITSPILHRKDSGRFVIESEKDIPNTIGDYDKILQVVLNLISNALKFSEEGDIILKVCHSDGQLTIAVSDKGIGIPIEEQEMIFEKFRQIGDTLTDKPAGTGLGLPICKEIVGHHGGQIWASSVKGQGSTFSFTLPVVQADQD